MVKVSGDLGFFFEWRKRKWYFIKCLTGHTRNCWTVFVNVEVDCSGMGDRIYAVTPGDEIEDFSASFMQLLEAAYLLQAKKYPRKQGAFE